MSKALSDNLIHSTVSQTEAHKILAAAELAPEQSGEVRKTIAHALEFTARTIFARNLGNSINTLMDYPGVFVLVKDDITKAMGRALTRADHPSPFQGLGTMMVPAAYVVYMGHLEAGDPVEHFASKQFIEQLQTLAKKPELFVQVVTPEMIEKAVEYVTFLPGWRGYKYAPALLDVVDQYPQFQDAAQNAILGVMHRQLGQDTGESQRLGLQYCQQLAQDLMAREKFADFLAVTVEKDEVIGEALRDVLLPSAPQNPVAKETLGKLNAKGKALAT